MSIFNSPIPSELCLNHPLGFVIRVYYMNMLKCPGSSHGHGPINLLNILYRSHGYRNTNTSLDTCCKVFFCDSDIPTSTPMRFILSTLPLSEEQGPYWEERDSSLNSCRRLHCLTESTAVFHSEWTQIEIGQAKISPTLCYTHQSSLYVPDNCSHPPWMISSKPPSLLVWHSRVVSHNIG